MFKLRALHGDVRLLDARGIELSLRLRDIGFWRGASFEAVDRELKGVGIGLHRVIQELLLRIGKSCLQLITFSGDLLGACRGSGRPGAGAGNGTGATPPSQSIIRMGSSRTFSKPVDPVDSAILALKHEVQSNS